MTALPRLPDIESGPLSDRQRAVFDRIRSGPRGEVVGPLRVWLHSPDLADLAQALGQYARYDSSLPTRLSELAILVTARIWSSGFEWAHHAPIAEAAGLAPAAVAAIGRAEVPALGDPRDAAVFAFAVELQRDRAVSDTTFATALDTLGTHGIVDLLGVCGYYGLISMTINAARVPDGDGPRLPVVSMPPERYFAQHVAPGRFPD